MTRYLPNSSRLTSGPAYQKFRRKWESSSNHKSIHGSKAQLEMLVDFIRAQKDGRPEIKAWVQIYAEHYFNWDDVFGAYQRLQKYRPKDLLPKMMLLMKGMQLRGGAADALSFPLVS